MSISICAFRERSIAPIMDVQTYISNSSRPTCRDINPTKEHRFWQAFYVLCSEAVHLPAVRSE